MKGVSVLLVTIVVVKSKKNRTPRAFIHERLVDPPKGLIANVRRGSKDSLKQTSRAEGGSA